MKFKICCEIGRKVELAQDYIQQKATVLVVLSKTVIHSWVMN